MPGTGEEIPCDRRVVYGTLGMWYSKEGTDPLDTYDREAAGPNKTGFVGNHLKPSRL